MDNWVRRNPAYQRFIFETNLIVMNTAIKFNNAMVPSKSVAPEAASVLMQRAIEAFNRGQQYLALQSGKYALHMARKEQSPLRSEICTFLAHLKWLNGNKGTATFYTTLALQYLDRKQPGYAEDKRYLTELLAKIDEESKVSPGGSNAEARVAA